MTDFYSLADGRTTGFYLGADGTCEAVDKAIEDWHKRILRERQEAFAMRQPFEECPE